VTQRVHDLSAIQCGRSPLSARLFTLIGSLLLATGSVASAKEMDTDDDAATTEPEPEEIQVLAATREGLYGSAYWLVANVDSWFGDQPFEEGGSVSGALRLRLRYREDDGFDTDLRYRIRVHMPNVSERGYIFLGRDSEQDLIRDEDDGFRRDQRLLPDSLDDDQTFFAGIGIFLRENLDLRVGVRGGYKVYTQARYRKSWWLTDRSNIEYRQTLFLAVGDGFGTTTGLNYAYAITPRTAVRWRNSATVSTETDGVDWSTNLGLFHAFPADRRLSAEVLGRGETGNPVPVREYGVRGTWSQPIYRDWIIGEVIIGYFWPRGDDDPERGRSWAAGLSTEIRF